jgi:hypothetical protein
MGLEKQLISHLECEKYFWGPKKGVIYLGVAVLIMDFI